MPDYYYKEKITIVIIIWTTLRIYDTLGYYTFVSVFIS